MGKQMGATRIGIFGKMIGSLRFNRNVIRTQEPGDMTLKHGDIPSGVIKNGRPLGHPLYMEGLVEKMI